MAKGILASSTSLSNPVAEIAYLIETALQERCDFSPEDNPYADYLRALSTLMGLGFTAILAEGSQIRPCKSHLTSFLRYRDFIRHRDKLTPLSTAIAETVCSAIRPFKQLGFPLYYDGFVQAFASSLKSHDAADSVKEARIKELIQLLFGMCK